MQEYRDAYEISPQNPVFQTAYERLTKQANLPAESPKPTESPVINEVRAVGNVRVIATALTTYCNAYKHPPGSLADLASANLISPDLASGETSGYSFSYRGFSCLDYMINAGPTIWNSTGTLSVYLDEARAIHATRENRPATLNDPVCRRQGTFGC